MLVSFAEYRPDIADLNSAYTSDLLNVLPADGAYIPAPGLAPLTGALDDIPLGGFRARQLDGTVTIFAGTAEKLWQLDNTSLDWSDVSQAATSYHATDVAPWCFNQFGNYVIAVNENDDPQVLELGVDSAFRDLGGDPPRAGVVRIWGDFVVLMRLTSNPDRAQWSGLNDAEFWTPGQNNSDYQTFPDGGTVQGSNEQTNPIIFQERAIRLGTFVPGSAEIFTFQKIHDLRGAKSANSIAYRGSYAFYADEGGFFQIGTDGSLGNIGFEKVDKTIFGAMTASDIGQIFGVVDPFFSRVYWAVDLAGAGIYDTVIVYDWNLSRWSKIAVQVRFLVPLSTTGYTLESLDDVSSSLDALPFSLDSKVWQGGAPILGAFSPDNKLGSFSGLPLEATITTQETGDTAGSVLRIASTYPIVDTDQVRVSYGVRMRRSDAVTWMPEQAPSSNTGIVRKRARARFARMKMRLLPGIRWTRAQGIDVAADQAGFR